MNSMITVPGILTSVSLTSDHGLRIGFTTQELTESDKSEIIKHHQQFGWIGFKENPINLDDMPKEQAEGEKSQSKRIRASLFVLHTQRGGTPETFEVYYRKQTDEYIERIKAQLD